MQKKAERNVARGTADTASSAALGGLKPLNPAAWDYAKARHLLVRAGFGGTLDEVEKLHDMGLYEAVDYMVDYHLRSTTNIDFDAFPPERPLPLESKLGGPIRGKFNSRRQQAENNQLAGLRRWWLRRMVESPNPLQEKLALFWHGHFAAQYTTVKHSYIMYLQNQLFREHANGNFGALLYGIVHDPAMLLYLDNNQNVKGKPNENLAREIMELFSMGLDQGYTEQDIRQASRALTGYTYDHYTGQFRYIADSHDVEDKTVFGKTGNWTGDDLVTLILEQPETARFIALRLFQFFAYENPSQDSVDRLARVLRVHQYDQAPLLKSLFLSEQFYSQQAMGTQIKSPVQLVVGALRDLGVEDANYATADSAVQQMGQQLFEPPDVKGWRRGRAWINANRVFIRYNLLASVVTSVPQPEGPAGVDVVGLLEEADCKTAAEIVDYLARCCLVQTLNPQKRTELLNHLGELPAPEQWAEQRNQLNAKLRTVLVLMFSIPEYQMT